MKMKKLASLALALCMVFALAACGDGGPAATEPPATEPAASEDPREGLTAYDLEGAATVYLPEGGETYYEEQTDPLPTIQCGVNIGDVNMHLGIIGMDAYEVAGVSLPETVEEFSQRSGPQSDVGEGQVFDYDDYGNYCTQFTRDGRDVYYAVRVRENGTAALAFSCPEGTIGSYNPGLWISLIELT